MVQQPLFEQLALVGLSLPLPLFAVAVQQYRGSPFGDVLTALSAALGFGIATVLVGAFPAGVTMTRLAVVAFVGAAAVLSAASVVQLTRMTTGRCSV